MIPVSEPTSPSPKPEAEQSVPQEELDELFAHVDITRPDPKGPMDEWVNWTAGRDEEFVAEVQEQLSTLGAQLGIEGLEAPSDYYVENGWIGVAPYGPYCIVGVRTTQEGLKTGSYALSVLSRINWEAEMHAVQTTELEALKQFAAFYSDWCHEGGDWPGTPPGSKTQIEINTLDDSVNA